MLEGSDTPQHVVRVVVVEKYCKSVRCSPHCDVMEHLTTKKC